MEIDGIPVFVFVGLGIGAIAATLMVFKLGVLARELGFQGDADPEGFWPVTRALYSGEGRLHDMGVHRTVWTIRILFLVNALSIFATAVLIYKSEAA
jgi:hypothetical protein